MMEEEFEKLLNAVSEDFGISQYELMNPHSQCGKMAKSFLCHIIHYGFPHLKNFFLKKLHTKNTSYMFNVRYAERAMCNSIEYSVRMSEIRSKLGIQRYKRRIKNNIEPSISQRLFGFDYSEDDIYARHAAFRESKAYMQELCSIGHTPKQDRVFKRPL